MTSTGVAAGFFQGVTRRGADLERRADAGADPGDEGLRAASGRRPHRPLGTERGQRHDGRGDPTGTVNGTIVNGGLGRRSTRFASRHDAARAPQGLAATPGDGSVSLSWTANSESRSRRLQPLPLDVEPRADDAARR